MSSAGRFATYAAPAGAIRLRPLGIGRVILGEIAAME